jgi:hypothetical protein
MFTLLKLGASLIALLAFAWFGMTYKLGSRTLFEHVHAIGQTKESQELVDGTRQLAGPLVDDVRHRVAGKVEGGDKPPPMGRDAGAPQDRLTASEQRQLKYLLDKVAH